ncbi:hypothetical protein CASFOL_032723 [Castilleja foliolosa]|uniref:Brf1 TBP-binding domain-containing protein n=1 Tax=Castilleja foliolosa TaxID=1961234 RepID=A0ABD3C2X9_9LAMI
MVWCSSCAKNITRPDYAEGKTCCSLCGKVLDDDIFSQSSNGQRRTNSKSENEVLQSAKAGSTGMAIYPRVDATLEESESLSDIDDIEVDLYLHADEETKYKTRIWEIINKEYLERSSNGQRGTNSKSQNEVLQSAKAGSTGATGQQKTVNDATFEESESLSDIDDIEDDLYLHIDEETKYKTRIWEIINKEYLEEYRCYGDAAPLEEASNGQRRTNSKSQNEVLQSAKAGSTGATGQHKTANDATFEESESLSDFDDIEDDLYLHIDEETKYKTRIWEIINKDYLEEQAAKEAVELAAKKAYEAAFANRFTDELNRSVEQKNPI